MITLDPAQPITLDQIRDIAEAAYRLQLGADGVKSMLAKDAEDDPSDNGAKLRRRAIINDRIVRDVLEVLGYKVRERVPQTKRERAGIADPDHPLGAMTKGPDGEWIDPTISQTETIGAAIGKSLVLGIAGRAGLFD